MGWSRFILPAVGSVLMVVACTTDAVGIEACRQVETARCKRAESCGFDLSTPPHPSSESNVDACVRFYRDACMHGLVAKDPLNNARDACVTAIETGSCGVVRKPETDPACSWLIPEAEVTDAGLDATSDGDSTTSAPVDAGSDATDSAPADASND